MKNHSQLPEIFVTFVALMKTHFSYVNKTFRIENAIKYRDAKLFNLLSQHGTTIHWSCLSTSQQNGQVECKHKHI